MVGTRATPAVHQSLVTNHQSRITIHESQITQHRGSFAKR